MYSGFGHSGEGNLSAEGSIVPLVISFSLPVRVGKSTLLNHILGREQFAHQAVSQHTGRGRNTTRHSELVRLMDSLYVMDTPGYTSLDLDSRWKTDWTICSGISV